jgi:general secretion pathway protein E/type IV pilus assembly protein PilB
VHRFGAAIVSRLKIMAGLNIAEKRLPQDGRITFRHRVAGQGALEFDLRVSVIPMLFGEGVVLRVLSKSAAVMPLSDLGMPDEILAEWTQLVARPHGILLVTGPTGSGKSTTLYASLNTIVSDEIKVITVEDPVEYHVAGVNQIQVNHKVGLTFAAGLRSILRHDPDVVMIGEIRDKETAETAIQASLTGHLVFSTLHTNDACGAATRLLDMGVEPFLVSSSVEAVLAQRLVRRLCAVCGVIVDLDSPIGADSPPAVRRAHAAPVPPELGGRRVPTAIGCRACRGTGYRGRVGVYELLRLSEATRQLVMERASSPRLASTALGEKRLRTLRQDGFTKVRAGVTTVDEVAGALSE